jgi:hypothetical protein
VLGDERCLLLFKLSNRLVTQPLILGPRFKVSLALALTACPAFLLPPGIQRHQPRDELPLPLGK